MLWTEFLLVLFALCFSPEVEATSERAFPKLSRTEEAGENWGKYRVNNQTRAGLFN